MSDTGTLLKELRESIGYKQEYVARKLMVSVSTVARWENSDRKPTIEHIQKLAHLYNVSIDTILGAKRENDVLTEQLTSGEQQLVRNIVSALKEHRKQGILTGNHKQLICDLMDAFLQGK